MIYCYVKSDRENIAYRYVFGSAHGETPLVFFGINPSYATPEKLDPTTRRIEEIFNGLNKYGTYGKYDSWIVLNIYPEINKPAVLAQELSNTYDKNVHEENIRQTEKYAKNATLVAAWGNAIEKHPRFKQCLKEIIDKIDGLEKTWYCLGETQRKNPKSPLALDLLHREINEDFLKKEWNKFGIKQYYKDKLPAGDDGSLPRSGTTARVSLR